MLAALLIVGCIIRTGSGDRITATAAENLAHKTAVESITTEDIKQYVTALADDSFEGREAGTRGGHAAGMYLSQLFAKYKLRPAGVANTYFQPFGNNCRNVVGVLEGSDPALKQQYVLIGAHYDHVGFGNRATSNGPIGYIHNGADDNASGVAGMLEAIEALTKLPQPPGRSIVFALWDSEEQGLYGSKHWAAKSTVPLEQVVISINLDMIGKLRGNRLEVMGARTSAGLRRLLSEQNRSADLLLDFQWEMSADSDHYTFFKAGLPSIMFHTGLHDDYHRPGDDAHKLNYEGTQRVSKFVLQALLALADEPDRRGFRAASRNESSSTQRVQERPAKDSPARLGVRWIEESQINKSSIETGVLLSNVSIDSPAQRGELRANDRIVLFAGRNVEGTSQLSRLVWAATNPVEVVIERAGEKLSRQIVLAGEPVRIGIAWREDDAEPNCVGISRVTNGTPAHEAGLRVNDRVYQVNGNDIAGVEGFEKAIREIDGSLEFLVETKGRLRTVQVKPLELLRSPVLGDAKPTTKSQ